jgi:excisionase family DNA binding protein
MPAKARTPITTPPPWLTVQETAHETRLTERGVRQLIADGRLPASRIGRNLRIRRADVETLFVPVVAGSDE